MAVKILKENEEGFGIIIDRDSGYIAKNINENFINENITGGNIDLSEPPFNETTLSCGWSNS